MAKVKNYRPMAEINVVPYIDVMLVLLIIFMVTAPLLFQGVDVNLPQAAAKALDAKAAEPIVLSLDAQGRYFLNIGAAPSQPISESQLLSAVTHELQVASKTPRSVLIKGDRSLDYGKIIQAMVLLQQAGATQIGLIAQPK